MATSGIDGFTRSAVTVNGVRISVHSGGAGHPLLLLHGFPQNHMAWARVAPEFARRFRCMVPDLRGYGDSGVPESANGAGYEKRVMASDMVEMMTALGHPVFSLLGHDRGARVAYRLAMDHPARVVRIGIVEVIPTSEMWRAFDAGLALRAYHWTHLAQPAPLPEMMIEAGPDAYLRHTLASWTRDGTLACFLPAALESFGRQMSDPRRIHAMCEDYRAGATLDRELDERDVASGRRVSAPLHFLWTDRGFPARTGDPLAVWRRWADRVSGNEVVAGHFVMDENPDAVTNAFMRFFAGGEHV